jgi:hypothetical protein
MGERKNREFSDLKSSLDQIELGSGPGPGLRKSETEGEFSKRELTLLFSAESPYRKSFLELIDDASWSTLHLRQLLPSAD